MADIHQPMHVSFASDLGGNRLKIKWLTDRDSQSKNRNIQKCKNMHQLWDDCLLRYWHKKTHPKQLFAAHLKTLNQKVHGLSDVEREGIVSTDLWQWATESLLVARSAKVKYCQQQPDNDFCLPFRVKTMYLLPDYHHQFAPVAYERIMHAGLRLGHILKVSL